MVGEEDGHLIQHFFDSTLLFLVCVKYFEKLFVCVGFIGEMSFDGGDIVDGMIEFNRLLWRLLVGMLLLLLLLLHQLLLLLSISILIRLLLLLHHMSLMEWDIPLCLRRLLLQGLAQGSLSL